MFPRGVVTAVRPFQTILLSVFFVAPGALVGCGGGQAQMREQMDTLRIEMRELSDSQQALVQKNENLKNRLELLEDKQAGLDLRRSMRSRTELPVVRVQPKRTPRNEPPPSVITQSDLDRVSPPPALPKSSSRRKTRRAIPPPPIAAQAGNVGVRPVPARPKYRKLLRPRRSLIRCVLPQCPQD